MDQLLHIGLLAPDELRDDDEGVSFTVLTDFVPLERCASDRMTLPAREGRCAEVRTSRTARKRFQLESLILAQNERWRQA